MNRDLARTKGSVQQAVERAGGAASMRQLEADAILFERQRQAEAILAEKRALAEGLLEQARAMSGSGGRQMVKLKLAAALQGPSLGSRPMTPARNGSPRPNRAARAATARRAPRGRRTWAAPRQARTHTSCARGPGLLPSP